MFAHARNTGSIRGGGSVNTAARQIATIVEPGALSLIEDMGRPGQAALGLSPSGAVDKTSLKLANRLLGNDDGAAGLEVLAGGLTLRFERPTTFAVTGARGILMVDAKPAALNTAITVRAGAELHLDQAEQGLRYYVGFSGGLAADQLLNSSSSDILSGLGPPPLRAGDQLWSGQETDAAVAGADAAIRNPPGSGALAARISAGPRQSWFEPSAWATLLHSFWTVSADSNRVGIRLEGSPLRRRRHEELPSEGLVLGALQVPPSGTPTVFLADHPVTGGYPVIAVVHRADLDLLGQARPGQQLRFLAG